MIGTFNIAWHDPDMAADTFAPRPVRGVLWGAIGIWVRPPDPVLADLEDDELLPEYVLVHIPSGFTVFATANKAVARYCAKELARVAPDPWPLPFGARVTGTEAGIAAFRTAVRQLMLEHDGEVWNT